MNDLNLAFECAAETLAADPALQSKENAALARSVRRLLDAAEGTVS